MHAPICAALALSTVAVGATAVDLTVGQVRVQHAVQLGSTKLVAQRSGWVRVLVNTNLTTGSVPNVDGIMHVLLDGQAIPGSPFRSLNGPIAAPPSPSWGTVNHALEFPLLLPAAGTVSLVIELDPWNVVDEANVANNVSVVAGLDFLCRDAVEHAYLPIDYTPGLGMPDEALMRPGVGDAMVQAIFGSGGTLYHPAPLPPLVWEQSIGGSFVALLGTLQDIRLNQIPAAGYPRPEFVYGWLPGNPYWGNGHAVSIPGDVAFGNTDPERFQRTFAHELGHLVGRIHINATINSVGVDVEHHLLGTENLPQLVPAGKFDVMVPGKLTKEAWVNNGSFHAFVDDPRMACGASGNGGGAGGNGGGDDAPTMAYRVGGVLDHEASLMALRPVMPVWAVPETVDDPDGNVSLQFLAGDEVVHAVRVRAGTSREICVATPRGQAPPIARDSWESAIVPASILANPAVDTLRAVRVADGAVLGERWRSPTPPTIVSISAARVTVDPNPVDPGPIDPNRLDPNAVDSDPIVGDGPGADRPQPQVPMLEVAWTAADADGDALSVNVLYSPDGARWVPLALGATASPIRVDFRHIPAPRGELARVRVVVSDGFDVAISEGGLAGAVGPGNPPRVDLMTPNDSSTHRQHAAIFLHAAAWDLEDGILPASSIVWTSDIDGPIGTGRLLQFDGLSPGEHVISVSATDSDGMVDSDTVKITVLARPSSPGNPDLNGDGVVNGADLGLLLFSWGPCPGCQADLNGDGVVDGADLGALLAAWSS